MAHHVKSVVANEHELSSLRLRTSTARYVLQSARKGKFYLHFISCRYNRHESHSGRKKDQLCEFFPQPADQGVGCSFFVPAVSCGVSRVARRSTRRLPLRRNLRHTFLKVGKIELYAFISERVLRSIHWHKKIPSTRAESSCFVGPSLSSDSNEP